jgi:glycosyltransferase involved in cell wall biosynthesis
MAEMRGEKRVVGMVAACPFPSSQGSQVLIRQLSGALTRLGHSVHVISYPFGDLPPDPFYQLHRIKALVPFKKLDPGPSLLKPVLDLLLLIKVIAVARREKIDLLHGHNYEGIIVAWAAGKWVGIPSIYNCHSLLADELPTYFSARLTKRLSRLFGNLIDRITASLPDYTIAISPEISRQDTHTEEKGGRVKYLTPGIVREEWEGIDLRDEVREEGLRIVYTGNLARFQNIQQLLEVIRSVCLEFPDVTLEVITPSNIDPLVDLARSVGVDTNLSVIVENDFKEIIPRLLRADIACSMRTMKSGFPVKNLNYMAAGLPIICYESGAKGIIDGETGFVVKDNDTIAFTRAASKLLKDKVLRKSMGKKGREIAFRDYNWEDLIVKVEEIHESLL